MIIVATFSEEQLVALQRIKAEVPSKISLKESRLAFQTPGGIVALQLFDGTQHGLWRLREAISTAMSGQKPSERLRTNLMNNHLRSLTPLRTLMKRVISLNIMSDASMQDLENLVNSVSFANLEASWPYIARKILKVK